MKKKDKISIWDWVIMTYCLILSLMYYLKLIAIDPITLMIIILTILGGMILLKKFWRD